MGRNKKNKPRRQLMAIVNLTPETVPAVARASGKSEEELMALVSMREEQGEKPYIVKIPRKVSPL
jgi:hypothetical protein